MRARRDMAAQAIDKPLAYMAAGGVVIAGGMVLGPAMGGGYTVTGLIDDRFYTCPKTMT